VIQSAIQNQAFMATVAVLNFIVLPDLRYTLSIWHRRL